ncbi:cytochrome-c peroxidase [Vicingaceae bacterium]|nr:cytochrome-c peroxidase [Vicingaceae bacterium]
MKCFKTVLIVLIFISCSNQEKRTAIKKEKINAKVNLGKKLFFDPILSLDKSISCASCHQPQFAFADNKSFSIGVNDSIGTRNTPSVMNMASRPFFFHDGRAATLEEQAVMPVENPVEMNLSFKEAVNRINKDEEYLELFKLVYKTLPNSNNITNALAEFQRSLESDGSAPHDLWIKDIDTNALTISQRRGRELFISDEFKCFECHFGPDFTGDEFRNIGLFDGVNLLDKGRFDVTKDSNDIGKFKTPGLRNIALTAPYMHNGMFNTLEEVISFYSNPYDFVEKPINLDTLMIEPLNITGKQKADLVNFLNSLTDKDIPFQDEKLEQE